MSTKPPRDPSLTTRPMLVAEATSIAPAVSSAVPLRSTGCWVAAGLLGPSPALSSSLLYSVARVVALDGAEWVRLEVAWLEGPRVEGEV